MKSRKKPAQKEMEAENSLHNFFTEDVNVPVSAVKKDDGLSDVIRKYTFLKLIEDRVKKLKEDYRQELIRLGAGEYSSDDGFRIKISERRPSLEFDKDKAIAFIESRLGVSEARRRFGVMKLKYKQGMVPDKALIDSLLKYFDVSAGYEFEEDDIKNLSEASSDEIKENCYKEKGSVSYMVKTDERIRLIDIVPLPNFIPAQKELLEIEKSE